MKRVSEICDIAISKIKRSQKKKKTEMPSVYIENDVDADHNCIFELWREIEKIANSNYLEF